jgi:peptide/nickel transport system permease protein
MGDLAQSDFDGNREAGGAPQKRPFFLALVRRFYRHKLAMAGLVVLCLEVTLILALPRLAKLDPYTSARSGFGAPPSKEHILGTDDTGRDNFSRIVYGGRTSLFVGFFSATLSLLIGVPLGLLAGYYRGVVEAVIMRTADIFMAFPSVILILVLVSIIGTSVVTVAMVIGMLGGPTFARQLYANVLSVREKDYVDAARAAGTRHTPLMIRYILPNAFAPVLVVYTFQLANAILAEATLSFLGMGVQPPDASWGNILYAAQSITILSTRPWMWLSAGLCLLFTVLSINFVGDGLRDALDPKMKV